MALALRIFLFAGAVCVLLSIASRIRRKKIQMQDSIFWVVLSAILVLVAIFPRILYGVSEMLGFASPSNFVFLVIIAVLLIKQFDDAEQISTLKHRVNQLAQEIALAHSDDESDHAE